MSSFPILRQQSSEVLPLRFSHKKQLSMLSKEWMMMRVTLLVKAVYLITFTVFPSLLRMMFRPFCRSGRRMPWVL